MSLLFHMNLVNKRGSWKPKAAKNPSFLRRLMDMFAIPSLCLSDCGDESHIIVIDSQILASYANFILNFVK